MKKTIRRIFSLLLSLAMCMALTLTVFADSQSAKAGVYGLLRGECCQNEQNPYELNTSTSVKQNNNDACLQMYIDIWELGGTTAIYSVTSQPGDLLLAHDVPLYVAIDFEPEHVHVDHQIVDPSTGDILYIVSTMEVLSFTN